VRVGETIPYEHMCGITDRTELTALLRRRVFALCPHEMSADRVGRIRALNTARTTRKDRSAASSAAPHDRFA